jgi:hypothetical protein
MTEQPSHHPWKTFVGAACVIVAWLLFGRLVALGLLVVLLLPTCFWLFSGFLRRSD